MGELESLLLVLIVLYIIECLVWVRRGLVGFINPWFPAPGTGRAWHPGTTLGNTHGAICFANPLPPFGAIFLGQQWPLSLSPEGALAFNSACLNPTWRPRQTGQFIPFDAMQAIVRDGRKIVVNGSAFVEASSPGTARAIVRLLQELKQIPAPKRGDAIRSSLEATFDLGAAKDRLVLFKRASLTVRLAAISLFVFLFLIAPTVISRYGLNTWVWPLVAILLAHTVTIAFLFRRAYHQLFPKGDDERFTPFLTMLLAPTSALRATDVLSKPLFEPFHALTVARLFLSDIAFRDFARHALRDLQNPMLPACPNADDAAVQTEEWFRGAARQSAETFVSAAGLKLDDLLEPAAPAESAMRAYCARCDAQFLTVNASCADCGGRPVQPWGNK
jgi:hypothetical protein